MLTFLDGPAAGNAKGLCIRRCPLFLRVTHSDKGEWDALDQLEDKPRYNEDLFAYRLVGKGQEIHIYRRPGPCGYFWIATYRFVEAQPLEGTLRYKSRWREWCLKQVEKEKVT